MKTSSKIDLKYEKLYCAAKTIDERKKKKVNVMGVRRTALRRLMPAVTTNMSIRQCEALLGCTVAAD